MAITERMLFFCLRFAEEVARPFTSTDAQLLSATSARSTQTSPIPPAAPCSPRVTACQAPARLSDTKSSSSTITHSSRQSSGRRRRSTRPSTATRDCAAPCRHRMKRRRLSTRASATPRWRRTPPAHKSHPRRARRQSRLLWPRMSVPIAHAQVQTSATPLASAPSCAGSTASGSRWIGNTDSGDEPMAAAMPLRPTRQAGARSDQ